MLKIFTLVFLYLFLYSSFANENILKNDPLKYLVKALKEIDHPKAFDMALNLGKIKKNRNNYDLIIRKAELDVYKTKKIADAIYQIDKLGGPNLITLSMSFNQSIKDEGLNLILEAIPDSTKVLAFVECGLTDKGALKIIDYVYKHKNINQIYLEGNYFSKAVQNKFYKLKLDKPDLTIISQWPSQNFKKMIKKTYN
ncbi:hypothetical protein OAQ56_02150 [Alphaproteobacteria bacterium]|nr:hypothetical protein [Alphaproteobacteria bacterium]